VNGIQVLPITGIPEISSGDDLADVLISLSSLNLENGDVLVVTHKIVAKAEGRIVDLRTVEPSALAKQFAREYGKDPRQIEVVLRETRRIVRMDRGVIISETHHGFVCANAGVDASNIPDEESVCLLPVDPDASARRIRETLSERLELELALIVSDSFGRAWRFGITDIAIGVAGMNPLVDYRGQKDEHGRLMDASVLAVADEISGASELVMGKTDGVPAAIVRGYDYERGVGVGTDLIMPPERDMFR
jgi:coenzyme F420-0:L-glutamate ligase/coenzyme F420-1:gamma-L-glutamate ligase